MRPTDKMFLVNDKKFVFSKSYIKQLKKTLLDAVLMAILGKYRIESTLEK